MYKGLQVNTKSTLCKHTDSEKSASELFEMRKIPTYRPIFSDILQ